MGLYDGFGNLVSQENRKRKVTSKNINLFDPSKYIIGVATSSGINSAQATCITTDFIPVEPGKKVFTGVIKKVIHNPFYTASSFESSCYGISFYEEKQDARIGSGYDHAADGVTVPADAKYVRVSFMSVGYFYPVETPEKFYVCVSDEVTDNPHAYGVTMDTYILDNPFEGKTWTLFGDSFTDAWGGHSWDYADISAAEQGGTVANNTPWSGKLFASRIASELGLILDNRAHSGSNMCQETGTNYESVNGIAVLNQFIAEIEAGTIAQPDYITIAFGANAYNEQVSRENPDALNDYRGATKYWIETLREKCPNSVFGFVLPYDCNGVHGTKGIGREAILSVLETDGYKVPYIDMLTESGITVDMLPDGLHPGSYQANNLYYHAMRRFVMGL